jgi:hypothetical protein
LTFTDEQREILFRAWGLSQENRGQVLADDAYPAAHELAEHGWLERRFEPDGEMSWWLTAQGAAAIDLGVLANDAADRAN